MDDSIKGKSICPTCGKVQNIDLTVRSRGLPNPAQQDLLTVGLLQIWHDVFHYILHLQDSSNTLWTCSPLFLLPKPLNQSILQILIRSFPWKGTNQTNSSKKPENRSLQTISALCWLQDPVMLHVTSHNDTLLLCYDLPHLLSATYTKHGV